MKTRFKSLTLSLTTLVAAGAMAVSLQASPLIEANQLDSLLQTQNPLVLDIRQGLAEDKNTPVFEAGHIPGAVHAPYALFRGTKENPGQLIDEDKLEATLQSLGVTFERPIVVVHQGKNETDFGAAARVYWTLKSSGLEQLSILSGGVNAWAKAELALNTGVGKAVNKSDIDISFSNQWLATTADISAYVAGDKKVDLVDARFEDFWKGKKKHPAASRPGTLPQSRFFAHATWFDANDKTKIDQSKVAQLASSAAFTDEKPIVSFCNTGHWAATNWFALSELAGLSDVALYPGSLVEYSATDGKMINTPGLLKNLLNRATGQ